VSPGYMTLSYCWGGVPSLMLLRSNIHQLRKGNLLDELPPTFRDAMTVVRRFSIRYLWIDRLCIFQDSEEDWEREASAMRNVYTNSCCNISTAASSGPFDGLFERSRRNEKFPGQILIDDDTRRNKYYVFDGRY
jgi:Heterokaryon incompatibility protein (HET)